MHINKLPNRCRRSQWARQQQLSNTEIYSLQSHNFLTLITKTSPIFPPLTPPNRLISLFLTCLHSFHKPCDTLIWIQTLFPIQIYTTYGSQVSANSFKNHLNHKFSNKPSQSKISRQISMKSRQTSHQALYLPILNGLMGCLYECRVFQWHCKLLSTLTRRFQWHNRLQNKMPP